MADGAMLSARGVDIRMVDCAAAVVIGDRVTMRDCGTMLVFA